MDLGNTLNSIFQMLQIEKLKSSYSGLTLFKFKCSGEVNISVSTFPYLLKIDNNIVFNVIWL